MKKSFIFLICCIFTVAAKAQTAAGNMMIGGTLAYTFDSYSGGDSKANSTYFSPSFGYFVSDNLAIGGALSISSSSTDSGAGVLKSSSFGIGPFARYYKYTANEDFAFFGDVSILYSAGSQDNTAGGKTKSSFVSFDVSPGFAYFLTDHWGIELSTSL